MIHVSPLSRLPETLMASRAGYLITLLSPGAEMAQPDSAFAGRWLRLSFHDIDAPRDGLTPPSAEHVAALLEFAHAWDRRAALLVHCHAGISRSTAAAFAIACAAQPGRPEDAIAAELRRLSPMATPNRLIVAHADALLGRKGRMVSAIEGIGRGADAFEGAPFAMPIG